MIEHKPEGGPAGPGRSFWALAWLRLKRNRAAVIALYILAALLLLATLGPLCTGHPYDQAYGDYVREPASFKLHPDPERLQPALERLAARLRVRATVLSQDATALTIALESPRPIDVRNLVFLERSDLFQKPEIKDRQDEGRRLVVNLPIEHQRFLFGTDSNGRDLLTRTLYAGRISLGVGLIASLVALIIGVSYGAVAGFIGGRTDMLMMRAVDVLYALPFIFFVILLVVFFGRNVVLMFIAIGAVEWLDMARIVRGQTLSLKRQEFVQAAEALGVGPGAIVRRHIIPNLMGPVVVYVTLLVPKVILLESFLSFLGLGVQEPLTSLGVLISDGAKSIQGGAYMLIFPALFLILLLFALNYLGDGLRDALDPKDR